MQPTYLRTEKRLGSLQTDIVTAVRKEYLRILVEVRTLFLRARAECDSLESFTAYVHTYMEGFYAEICCAMLDNRPYKGLAWDRVQINFNDVIEGLDKALDLDEDEG